MSEKVYALIWPVLEITSLKTPLNIFTGNAIGESALLAYNRYYSDYVLELLKTDREKFLKKTFGFFRSRAFGKV